MAVTRRRGSVLVATRPIPRFRILSDLERKAEKDMERNLRQAIREIRQLVLDAPPDPAEQALIEAASMARSLGVGDSRILALVGVGLGEVDESFEDLRKTAEAGSPGLFDPEDQQVPREERRSRALVAHMIRKASGAPVDPSGWLADRDDGLIDLLLSQVPFRMGRLVPSRAGARELPPRYRQGREADRYPVALVDEFHLAQNVRSDAMRAILTGAAPAQIPEVVVHPLAEGMEPVYTVISGGETFLLALWAGLPALEMDVWAPPKAIPAEPTMLPAVDDMEELHSLMFEKFGRHQYKVPPALEPLAKLAREQSRIDFVEHFAGRAGAAEMEARQAADLANATRTTIWVAIARAARASGVAADTARRRAEKSPEWKRATSTWRKLERKAQRLEAAGHAGREEMRVAKAEAVNLSEQLDLPLSGPGLHCEFTLWLEARHGRIDSDELDELATPEEHPAAVARRLPNNVSERRFPNLYSYDGAPGVFTFARELEREDRDAPCTSGPEGEVYVHGSDDPPLEAYREDVQPVLVTPLDAQRADGGAVPPGSDEGECDACDPPGAPALVLSLE